jgi:uncharacterized membrane protein YkvA (DUF1232 family)
MGKHIEAMKRWVDAFAGDVEAVKGLVANQAAPREARLHGAAALNYLVTKLDLIPDWEETCGIIDDAMVLRVAMARAAERDLDALPVDALRGVSRLANEADQVREVLGPIYPRLERYVLELGNVTVRGRHPRTVVDDDRQREQLFEEIAHDLQRLPLPAMTDPDRVERTVLNYLSHKLK